MVEHAYTYCNITLAKEMNGINYRHAFAIKSKGFVIFVSIVYGFLCRCFKINYRFEAKFIHRLNDLHPIIYPLNTHTHCSLMVHTMFQQNWQKIVQLTAHSRTRFFSHTHTNSTQTHKHCHAAFILTALMCILLILFRFVCLVTLSFSGNVFWTVCTIL